MYNSREKLNLEDGGLLFLPDSSRIITRFFYLRNSVREENIIRRVCSIPEKRVKELLEGTVNLFSGRHRDIRKVFREHFNRVKARTEKALSPEQELLIGAYFTMEYSIESAALFNPSIVPHPDQSELSPGEMRMIMSFRAVGEGHISSIIFKTGTIGRNGEMKIEENGGFLEKGVPSRMSSCDYELNFDRDIPLSGRVIFPVMEDESRGLEDARFVRFTGNGRSYYATCTANNGSDIFPKLIETDDFKKFRITLLKGSCAKNKGMALFPEKVNGRYAMISRHDDENLFIIYSDDIYTWENPKLLVTPKETWELAQIGNCGSPIKTDHGWLLLTHGVGAVRRYCMGAILLDLVNPSRVIGTLRTPLICPEEGGRNGYVPNVIYSCGALIHQDRLIIPYAVSDTSSKVFAVSHDELIGSMERV